MRLAIAISPSRDSSFDRPHLAQVHAHRVVGAADVVVVEIAARLAVGLLGLGGGRLLVLLALDDVDAELGQHRHRVLDLLRGHLVGGQRGVQLVVGDVATLPPAGQHLLDRSGEDVEQRRLGGLLAGFRRFSRIRRFTRHATIPNQISERPGRNRRERISLAAGSPTTPVRRARKKVTSGRHRPGLAATPALGQPESVPSPPSSIVDQVIAGFGQSRVFTSHQHSDHMRPFAARLARGGAPDQKDPESTEGEKSASTVAANPFSRRCCRSAEASSPGRKASISKISRRSLSSSASGMSSAANSSATSPDQRRRLEQEAEQDLRAARDRGAAAAPGPPGQSRAAERVRGGAGRGYAPSLVKPVAHKAAILVAHGRDRQSAPRPRRAAGRDRRGARGYPPGRRRARSSTGISRHRPGGGDDLSRRPGGPARRISEFRVLARRQAGEPQAMAGLQQRQGAAQGAGGGALAGGVAVEAQHRLGREPPQLLQLELGQRSAERRHRRRKPGTMQGDHVHIAFGDDDLAAARHAPPAPPTSRRARGPFRTPGSRANSGISAGPPRRHLAPRPGRRRRSPARPGRRSET